MNKNREDLLQRLQNSLSSKGGMTIPPSLDTTASSAMSGVRSGRMRLASAIRERMPRAQKQNWRMQGERLKEIYPDFDLEKELENPDFLQRLLRDIPMEDVYKAVHFKEIMEQNGKKAQKDMSDNIKNRGARMPENGVSAQSGITLKTDVSKLTPAQRESIARRVALGEKITF